MAARIALVVALLATTYLKPTNAFPDLPGGMFTDILRNRFTNKIKDIVDNMVDTADKLHDQTNKAFGTVQNNLKTMTGVINGKTLVEIMKPKIDTSLYSQCLRGIHVQVSGHVNTDITLHDGKAIFEENKFEIEGSHEDEDAGQHHFLKILFKFTDLQVLYRMSAFGLKSRQGYVTFMIKNASTMIVKVKVISQASKLKELAKEDNCFVDLEDISSDVPGRVELSDYDYDSATRSFLGFGLTALAIQKLPTSDAVVTVLKQNVREGLLSILKPILYNRKIFCESSKYSVIEDPPCSKKGDSNVEVKDVEVPKESGTESGVEPGKESDTKEP